MFSTIQSPRVGRRLSALTPVLMCLVLLAAACGSDDSTSSDITEQSSDSTEQSADESTGTETTVAATDDTTGADVAADEAALEAAADELVVVCADQDRDRLRDLSGDGTKDPVQDRDPLFSSVEDLSVVSRQVRIDGDTATVTVTLDVTVDGETNQVERVWAYDKVDGSWVLSDVPDCLFS